MDFIWTPWRYSYVTSASDDDGSRRTCPFCRILESGSSDRDSLIVHRGETNVVLLNRYPYTSGHMMVVPHAHVASLAKVSASSADEMMRLTRRLEAILRQLYRPDGINLGMNIGRAAGAGVSGHIHMHALPRWTGDTSFATVIGETRLLPESLTDTWERVRAEFRRDYDGRD